MTEKKNILKSSIWSLLEQGGSKFAALILQIILARMLAPEVFGVMAILLVLLEIMNVLAQSGLNMSLIQSRCSDDGLFTTAFWLTGFLSLLLYAVVFFGSQWVAEFYSMPDLALYLKVFGLIIFLNSFNSIQRAYLQKAMLFKSLFRSNIAGVIVGGLVGISLAYCGWGIWSLIAQVFIQALIICMLMFIQVPWRPSFRFKKSEALTLFKYGWKICVTGILGVMYNGLSELIIGKTCSVAALGFYNQGRKYSNALMGAFSNAIENVMFPALSELQDSLDEFRETVKSALIVGSYLVVPLCFCMAVVAKPFVVVFLTEKWLPCVPIVQLTALGYIMLMPQIVNLRAYMALGDSRLYMNTQLFKVIFGSIVICGTAILTKNIYYIALAVFIVTTVNVIVVDLHAAKRKFGFSRSKQLRAIGPIIGVSVCSALIASFVQVVVVDYIAMLVLQATTFFLSYILLSKGLKLDGFEKCQNLFLEFRAKKKI